LTIANLVTSIRILLLAPLFALIASRPEGSWAALVLLVTAGLTDIADGQLARRLNQVSGLGAMLDLIADRLLILAVVLALAASGAIKGWALAAGFVLAARGSVVASFGEAVPGLGIRVTSIEKVKIALQFLGFGLLIAPAVFQAGGMGQHALGGLALVASAALTGVTVAGYTRLTLARLHAQVGRP
jgi:phosphatidylglycerophosphate synthase